jgi:AraC-like DNA-binding protein
MTSPTSNRLKLRSGFLGERSIVLPDMIQRRCEEDTFLNQLYITDIGYYPHAVYHYRERPVGVGQYILIYCIKGRGWYSIRNQRYEVKGNQWFIIPHNEPHVYASNNEDPWTIYWVHFTGQMAPFYATGHHKPTDIPSGITARISDRISIFEEIFLTLSDNYSLDNLRYASSLLYAFLATFRYLANFRKYNAQSNRINPNDIVGMAVRYMNENIEKPLTLAEISDYIGYSTSQFSLIFRNSTGRSPLNYFNMLKIQRACQLLENTDMKINQLCSKVGIDDSYYFSRLFTKIVGVSPKKYRQGTETQSNKGIDLP